MAIQYDLIWVAGRFNSVSLTFQDGAGTGIDLSGATLTAEVRSRPADTDGPGTLVLTLEVGELISGGSDPDDLTIGALSIWSEAEDLPDSLIGTVGAWELVVEKQAGRPERYALGRWECAAPIAVPA